MKTDLTQLKEKERGIIVEIQGGLKLIKKLEVLGIRPGVEIVKLSSHILKGPQTIQVGNTQVAIGFNIAKKIVVEKIK